ncbi:DUF5677 domain-containing protein [Synechococcus sp. CCY 9618]|uniref:DUF5677 domain-containing protein n=1 Tax=Synechococcus sp. CCY 9618 TaxID=2815602 RepID=UPI0020B39FD9|nr:DUF5677 domain-containing protein [Synechococcus sp. CCY 9618]
MPPLPSEQYLSTRAAFRDQLLACIQTSQRLAGIRAPTGGHFYASALFTVLCSRAVSLLKLTPTVADGDPLEEPWDYGSAFTLSRSLLEVRIAFFYLGIECVTEDEWRCRWSLMCLHDCTGRIRLFEHMDDDPQELERQIAGFAEQAEELRERLRANAFFTSLPEGRQRHLLRGTDSFLSPLEELAARSGSSVGEFKLIYRLLSSQVHALPISFFRMDEGNRGTGMHSNVEEGYIQLCLALATHLLSSSRTEMEAKFQGHEA